MSLQPDDSRAFLVGQLKPAAQLDRGRDVLLLKSRADSRAAATPATSATGHPPVPPAALPQAPQPESTSPSTPASTRAAATTQPAQRAPKP
jgi:rod shape-determining protein MreC